MLQASFFAGAAVKIRNLLSGLKVKSSPLESRLAFEKAVAIYAAKYAIGTVPRPPNWSGFRIVPLRIEFWHDRPFRLHDRIDFRRESLNAPWSKQRLYP